MQITTPQRKRIESNRQAAIERRNNIIALHEIKCAKIECDESFARRDIAQTKFNDSALPVNKLAACPKGKIGRIHSSPEDSQSLPKKQRLEAVSSFDSSLHDSSLIEEVEVNDFFPVDDSIKEVKTLKCAASANIHESQKVPSQAREQVSVAPELPLAPRFIFSVNAEVWSTSEFLLFVKVEELVRPGIIGLDERPATRAQLDKLQTNFTNLLEVAHRTVNTMHDRSMLLVPCFPMKSYEKLVRKLSVMPNVKLTAIPIPSLLALRKKHPDPSLGLQQPVEWVPDIAGKIPAVLSASLYPFQREGVVFAVSRGGRCLIADEMGVGKTVQAIALAAFYRSEGPILVVCPASLRLPWAEELEKWLPYLTPPDIRLVLGSQDDVPLSSPLPLVTVTSFTMLQRLRHTLAQRVFGLVIIDESHNLRTSKKTSDAPETVAMITVLRRARRRILLSGTPSLTRPFDLFNQVDCVAPGILGKTKFEFAVRYCGVQPCEVQAAKKARYQDFSRGCRLQELHVLLSHTLMIRRLKSDVLEQLPAKRRQVIRLLLDTQDIKTAVERVKRSRQSCRASTGEDACADSGSETESAGEEEEEEDSEQRRALSSHEIGVAKLRGVKDWLQNHPVFAADVEADAAAAGAGKVLIFGHHMQVLDEIQAFVQSRGRGHVRVDGRNSSEERQSAVRRFKESAAVQVAIVGVTAGGVGLDFSAAQTVLFAEIPTTAADLLQAEDRAHRRGQKSAVTVYIFCAKETRDEAVWQRLGRSVERVSLAMDGHSRGGTGIQVDAIYEQSTSSVKGAEAGSGSVNANVTQKMFLAEGPCSAEQPAGVSSHGAAVNEEPEGMGHGTQSGVEVEPDSLLFMVSGNTGRIHLFRGAGESAVPLEASVRQEDLATDSLLCGQGSCLPPGIQWTPQLVERARAFQREWSSVRPVLRRRLLGQALGLPLHRHLALDADEGLQMKKSTRRTTPRDELLPCHLPDGATWREVSLRVRGGQVRTERQAVTAQGDSLCRACGKEYQTGRSVERFMDLFCSKPCAERVLSRTSTHYIRQALSELERGVCALCSLDCREMTHRIRVLKPSAREAEVLRLAPPFAQHPRLLKRLVEKPVEGHAWHADHIVGVYEGGGECGLENLRTLCVVCHCGVTAEQKRKWAALKREEKAARNQKTIRDVLMKATERTLHSEIWEGSEDSLGSCDTVLLPNPSTVITILDDADDELLAVKVPGSNYIVISNQE